MLHKNRYPTLKPSYMAVCYHITAFCSCIEGKLETCSDVVKPLIHYANPVHCTSIEMQPIVSWSVCQPGCAFAQILWNAHLSKGF